MAKSKLTTEVVTIDSKKAIELIGFRVATKKETEEKKGHEYVNAQGEKERFVLTNNKTNRPFKMNLAKRYATSMLRGEWAGQPNSGMKTGNGESYTFDTRKQAISCAHRCVGLILADMERLRNPERCEEDFGSNGPITLPDCVIVHGIDPSSADSADNHAPRSFGDVLFRHNIFDEKDFNASQRKTLSDQLAHAVRLVWLRSHGLQVSKGPKLDHTTMKQFLDRHSLLINALRFVYDKDNPVKVSTSENAASKEISGSIPLGYAAGLLYLFATFQIDYAKHADNGSKIERKPDVDLWNHAEEFWTLFANADESGKQKKNEAVWFAYSVFNDVKLGKHKIDRDGKCTVLCRSFLAYINGEKTDKKKLKWGLENTAGKEGFVPEFVRVGGLDISLEGLGEIGLAPSEEKIQQSVKQEKKIRIAKGRAVKSDKGWMVDDLCWVIGTGDDPWFGEIESIDADAEKDAPTHWVHVCGGDKTEVYGLVEKNLSADKPKDVK